MDVEEYDVGFRWSPTNWPSVRCTVNAELNVLAPLHTIVC
jgi:hypothetical protein